jgi:hypothetical protein
VSYGRSIADGFQTGADDRETLPRSRRLQGWENVVAKLRQTDLQDLTAYLEKCSRNGKGAQLPPEWARQLLHVIEACSEILPDRAKPRIDPLEVEPSRYDSASSTETIFVPCRICTVLRGACATAAS